MDKRPPHMVSLNTIMDLSTPPDFLITDILMRMLKIVELKGIMGSPERYKLIGTQAGQKKFIGNAVEVTMARVLCEAICKRIQELKLAA